MHAWDFSLQREIETQSFIKELTNDFSIYKRNLLANDYS